MEEISKKQKKIRFSGNDAPNQNGASERAIKMVATLESIMFIYPVLRSPKDKLSND